MESTLHGGLVPREDAFGLGEVHLHVRRGAVELLLFVVLADVRFDDACTGNVLLNGFVEVVVLMKDPVEKRHGPLHDEEEDGRKGRDDADEDPRKVPSHDKGHDDGEDHHERAADGRPDDHHEGHLDVGDVRRHAGDEGRRGELIDVFEREVLDLVVDVLSQVLGKSCRCLGTHGARKRAAQKRHHRHPDENAAVHENARKIDRFSCRDIDVDGIDELCDDKGDQTFENDLARHEEGG